MLGQVFVCNTTFNILHYSKDDWVGKSFVNLYVSVTKIGTVKHPFSDHTVTDVGCYQVQTKAVPDFRGILGAYRGVGIL